MESLLPPIRVLDLSGERGYLCGRILGDLGADVIKIERLGGDSGRVRGPFYHDIIHPEKSLYWFAYNANKRGITLNIETEEGRELLLRLVRGADILIESYDPGYMGELGLGFNTLHELNPGLIMVSITPFGQFGPYRDYKVSDIVCMAMSGLMSTCGDPDRSPLRVGFPQAYLHAGSEAAVGALIAYFHRAATGAGQHVDISIQHSIYWCLAHMVTFWEHEGIVYGRSGQFRVGLSSGAKQRQLWRCKDGWISFQIYGGRFGAKSNRTIVEWMEREGMATDLLRSIDWETFDMAIADQEMMDKIEGPIAKFFLTHTMAELEEAALKKDIVLYVVTSFEGILGHPQLQSRNYWIDVEHPELGASITYPGPAPQASGNPLRFMRRAPLIGEHNRDIYIQEMGFTESRLQQLQQAGVI